MTASDRGPPPPPRSRRGDWRAAAGPTLIAAASLAAVLLLAGWWIASAPNWPLIARTFFSVEHMAAALPQVAAGFVVNLRIWLQVLVCIAILGLVLAFLRALRGPVFFPLRLFVTLYIDLFRGLPALLLVLLFGFGIPALRLPGLPTSSLFWGAVAMVLSYSAYVAEIYRSGIDSVPEGQYAAARALGLTEAQTLIWAIIPQALRNVAPALMNIVVALQKDVALLSVIGVRDAVREAQIYTAQTFNYSALVVAALLFLAATVPMARLADRVAARDRARRSARAA
jgi:polar amino acid transport system permease protein